MALPEGKFLVLVLGFLAQKMVFDAEWDRPRVIGLLSEARG